MIVQKNLAVITKESALWANTAQTRVGQGMIFQVDGSWIHAGDLSVDGVAEITALGGVSQLGRVAIQGDLALKGYQSIENRGVIGVGGLLEVFSVGSLTNSGLIAAENSIGITLAYGDLTNSGGVLSGGSTAFQVGGSFFNTGVFTARQSLVGNVTKLLVNTTPDPWNIYTDPAAPETLPWDTFGPLPVAPEPAILSAGQDLRLTAGGDVLNQESTLSGGRSMLLASGGSIINAGGRMMAGIGGSVIKGMTFTNTTAGGLIEEKDWDRYMVIYDDTKVYDTTIGGVPVLYRKNIGIMGYHRSRYFGGESGLLSAVGDLTVDVASGSNEASVIVSGGELNLLGLWENKSDYDVYSDSWLAVDEGFAEIGGTTRERMEGGGHDHFGTVARRVHDGTVSIRDDTGTGENRLKVFKYAEDVLGIDPREHGGEDTGWVAMESVVVMGGISDRTYLRFHLMEDYQEDEVHRTAIIHGHQGTNVILLNDDYGTSWTGIGGALAEQPFVVNGPNTGLAPGTVTVGAVNAIAAVGAIDLSTFSVPHTPVTELIINVARPIAPDVNLAIALGDLDSAPHVGLDVLESRLPTASSLPQAQAPLGQNATFTLSGYEPLTFLPPGNFPAPDGSIGSGGAGLPGYVFSSSSSGSKPVTGTLPDYYRDGNTLNGYTPTEPDSGTLPNVTLSQALLEKLTAGPSTLGPLLNTDVLRQNVRETLDLDPANVLDPDAWREISDQKGGNSLRTAVEGSLNVDVDLDLENVIDPELRDTLAAISTLGAYGGRDVFDAAGPMVNVGSDDGVITLETAKRKEIAEVIKERSQKYLEQELALKKQREDWIKEQLVGMEEGPARDAMAKSLEKEAEKKFGPSYYERIDLMTEAQNQRLYQELFPPEESGSGIWGMIIGIVIGVILAIVAPYILGPIIGALGSMATAAGVAVTAAGTTVVGALGTGLVGTIVSGVVTAVTTVIAGALQLIGAVLTWVGSTLVQIANQTLNGIHSFIQAPFQSLQTMAVNLVKTPVNLFSGTGSWATFGSNLATKAVSGAVNGFTSAVGSGIASGQGKLSDWLKGGVKAAGWGALTAVGLYTIAHSPLTEGFFNGLGKTGTVLRWVTDAALQGGIRELRGGDFANGFVTSLAGSVTGPLVETVFDGANESLLRVALSGVIGGGVEELMGGEFVDGFWTAAFTRWFNDEPAYEKLYKTKVPQNITTAQLGEAKRMAGLQLAELGWDRFGHDSMGLGYVKDNPEGWRRWIEQQNALGRTSQPYTLEYVRQLEQLQTRYTLAKDTVAWVKQNAPELRNVVDNMDVNSPEFQQWMDLYDATKTAEGLQRAQIPLSYLGLRLFSLRAGAGAGAAIYSLTNAGVSAAQWATTSPWGFPIVMGTVAGASTYYDTGDAVMAITDAAGNIILGRIVTGVPFGSKNVNGVQYTTAQVQQPNGKWETVQIEVLPPSAVRLTNGSNAGTSTLSITTGKGTVQALPSPPVSPQLTQLELNRINGRAFQDAVTASLRANENTGSVTVTLPNGKTVTTIPDLLGSQTGVTDVKNVINIDNTPQLKAQFAHALNTGQSFNLIVSPRTETISLPLQSAVRITGGKIFQFDSVTGSFTEVGTQENKVVR